MLSPTCLVSENNGPYLSTTDGYDCVQGISVPISIKLDDGTGVRSWSISCIGTDGIDAALLANVNAQLSANMDSVNLKTSYTVTNSKYALLFKSMVNNSIDANGVYQASYSTTFTIYNPVISSGISYRLIAAGEKTESNSQVGWLAQINKVITNL